MNHLAVSVRLQAHRPVRLQMEMACGQMRWIPVPALLPTAVLSGEVAPTACEVIPKAQEESVMVLTELAVEVLKGRKPTVVMLRLMEKEERLPA